METTIDVVNIIQEIFHFLRVLHFIKSDILPAEKLEYLYKCLTQRNVHKLPQLLIEQDETVIPEYSREIIDVEDAMLKIAFLRDNIRDIEQQQNNLVYKKTIYKFNNVYQNEHDELITNLYEFINKRVEACKNTVLLLYGYTGSGKSTITSKLLNILQAKTYLIYQIYNGKTSMFYNGKRHELQKFETVNDIKFRFFSTPEEVLYILKNFCVRTSTVGNKQSSRSHTIVKAYMQTPINSLCEVSILDLAGNERNNKKGLFNKDSIENQETVYINKSLYNVCQYLQNSKHKDSKCELLRELQFCKNIIFLLLMHDNPELKYFSSNHLVMLKNLYK